MGVFVEDVVERKYLYHVWRVSCSERSSAAGNRLTGLSVQPASCSEDDRSACALALYRLYSRSVSSVGYGTALVMRTLPVRSAQDCYNFCCIVSDLDIIN